MTIYTWKEIEKLLISQLKKTKHILVFGTIGPHNIEHDIDVIAIKKPRSSTSDFYREIHNIFYYIDRYLRKKYNRKVIRFSLFSHELEIQKLAKYRRGDLAFHTMMYNSLDELKIHWKKDLKHGESIKQILRKHYYLLFGKKSDLFSEKLSLHTFYPHLYIKMSDGDSINSNLSEKILIKKMNHLYDYVLKKRLGLAPLKAKSKKQVQNFFYKCLDIIDKEELRARREYVKNPSRYLVERDAAKIYEDSLKKAIKSSTFKNLGFVGFVFNYAKSEDYSINIITLPKGEGKIGHALIELDKLYKKTEQILKRKRKFHYYQSISPKQIMHEMIHESSVEEEGKEGLLPIHSIFYPNYRDFKKFTPKKFIKELEIHMISLFGKFDIIKKLPTRSQEKLEPYFLILHSIIGTEIKTKSKREIRATTDSLFEFLKDKYGLNFSHKIPQTKKEMEKLFYFLMEELDKRTYK